jgi:putative phosphoesterase
MSVKIVVIGDTHISNFKQLPKDMINAILESDWVIHVGDFISKNVLNGLLKLKGPRFKGVYGNADPQSIRDQVLEKDILEILGKRIGITHPAKGETGELTKKLVLKEFKKDNIDAIVYGHTHEPKIEFIGGILLINPGKGYLEKSYFGPSTSFAIITIDKEIKAEIQKINN